MPKLWSYSHYTGSGDGSGTGNRAWYRSLYRRQSLVPVPDFTGGTGSYTIPVKTMNIGKTQVNYILYIP